MYRIYSTLIEIVAAAVFIIPIWILFNCCFSIGRISKYNIIKS